MGEIIAWLGSSTHDALALLRRILSARSRNFDVWQGRIVVDLQLIMDQVVEGGVLTGEKIKFKPKETLSSPVHHHSIVKRRSSGFAGKNCVVLLDFLFPKCKLLECIFYLAGEKRLTYPNLQ